MIIELTFSPVLMKMEVACRQDFFAAVLFDWCLKTGNKVAHLTGLFDWCLKTGNKVAHLTGLNSDQG